MRIILFLLFIFCQVNAYGQTTSPGTSFPNDGLTYNLLKTENNAFHQTANGWRIDTINGGFNKSITNNPFVASGGDFIYFKKERRDQRTVFYYYKNGKKFTGKIIDTLELSYQPPIVLGIRDGNPYYENKNIKVIFQADCVNGSVQGKGTITNLNTRKIISECQFKNGEIIGRATSKGIYTNNSLTIIYERGKSKPLHYLQTDSNGKKVNPESRKDGFTLKTAYLNLSDPDRILPKRKRTEQEYHRDIQSLTNSTFLKNPLAISLYYINYASTLKPSKEYKTAHFDIKEVKFDDWKLIFYNFRTTAKKVAPSIVECYDENNNLVIIQYKNVLFDQINDLNYPDYSGFYGQFVTFNDFNKGGYGNFLVAFQFDDKKHVIKASRFRLQSGSKNWMYENFTGKIKGNPQKYPIPIIPTKD